MIKKKRKYLSKEERIIEKRKQLAKEKKVAAIWTRVSSADQFKKNNSIETQVEACRDFCAKHNITIKKEFGGENESAKSAGDLFLDMIGEIMNDPEYNCVVVFDFDRFSRDSHDGIIYKTKVKRSGINVLSVNQPIDPNNTLAEQIENILIIIADIDNAMRRHKCHDGMVSCVKRGELYSRPPFGYDSHKEDKTHVIKVNEKGKLLKLAFEWIANEPEISQAEVQRRLKVRGLDIQKQKLSQCLHNCFYCGLLEHAYLDGEIIKGVQEPLISEALFNKVQDILDGNHKDYQHSDITPDFPLKQHVFCAKDKHALSGYTASKRRTKYYKCGVKGCHTNVPATELHEKYREMLDELTIPVECRTIIEMVIKRKFAEKEGQDVKDIELISKNISTLETKLKNARTKFMTEDGISTSDYNEVKAELESKIAKCKAELAKYGNYQSNIAQYTDKVLKIASSLGSTWGLMNFAACQKIQNLVFPHGVLWDNLERCYRTTGMNKFLAQIANIHNCIEGVGKKEKDTDNSVSCLVAGRGLEPLTSGL